MSETIETPAFDEWCIVELFGHQRTAARVHPAAFPAGHVQLDIPAVAGHEAMTQIVSPQAIYRLTPTTKELATAFATECRPAPVHRWELPAQPDAGDRGDDVPGAAYAGAVGYVDDDSAWGGRP